MVAPRKVDTEALRAWATVRQLEILDVWESLERPTIKAVAHKLQVDHGSISRSLDALERKAASQSIDAHRTQTGRVPEGFAIKRRSAHYTKGELDREWVIAEPDKERQAQVMRDAFEAMAQDLPRVQKVSAPKHTTDKLATLYTLTDSHVGMLSWGKETGSPWDLRIAEDTLTGCFAQMVAASPPAKIGFVNQQGDFLHSDGGSGLMPVTPMHGHILDQDGRFSKLAQTAVRILRRVIDMALAKHEKVVVLMAEGNHDMASSIWLRVMFSALYENEPRVQVIDSELPYYCYQHGQTMLAFHHGHLKKNDQLPILFAAQFPQMWGATTKRYAHCGHRHHVEEKEHSGITVVQHPTLAARDAYAARGGWIAERQVRAITYHDQYGEVGRVTVTPEMLA